MGFIQLAAQSKMSTGHPVGLAKGTFYPTTNIFFDFFSYLLPGYASDEEDPSHRRIPINIPQAECGFLTDRSSHTKSDSHE